MVQNGYSVTVQWEVKTVQCSLPMWNINTLSRGQAQGWLIFAGPGPDPPGPGPTLADPDPGPSYI